MRLSSRAFPLLLLILWTLALIAGMGIYFAEQNAALLARELTSRLSSQFKGIAVTADSCRIRFFPLPSLRLNGLVLHTAWGVSLFSEECFIQPDWLSLLQGTPALASLSLNSPTLFLDTQPKRLVSSVPAPQANSSKSFCSSAAEPDVPYLEWLSLLAGFSLEVQKGACVLLEPLSDTFPMQRRQGMIVSGITGSVRLPQAFPADLKKKPLEMSGGTIEVKITKGAWQKGEVFHSIDDIEVQLEDILLKMPSLPFHWPTSFQDMDMAFKGAFSMQLKGLHPGMPPLFGKVTFRRIQGKTHMAGEVNLNGSIRLPTTSIPLAFHLPFQTPPSEGTHAEKSTPKPLLPSLYIPEARLVLDKDSMLFQGELNSEEDLENILLRGKVDVQQLSLPRWFDFARALPAGLQLALHDLSGTADVLLTPAALTVSRLETAVAGIPFKGKGGVADFSKPVIMLEAHTNQADVNKVLPELLGRDPRPPVFAFPSLFSTDDSPPQPDDVKYDIRLSAAKATFGKLDGSGLSLKIAPSPKGALFGRPRLELALKKLYGGKVQSFLTFEEALYLELAFSDISAETLCKRIAGGSSSLGGKLSGTAHFKGRGNTTLAFASSLQGKANLTLSNGFLISRRGNKEERFPFQMLKANFTGKANRSKEKRPSVVPFTGQWLLGITTPKWTGIAQAQGPVLFSTRNWLPRRIESLPVHFSGTAGKAQGTASLQLSLDIPASEVTLDQIKGQGTFGNKPTSLTSASGVLKGTHLASSPSWEGFLTLSSSECRTLLEWCGIHVQEVPAGVLRQGNFSGKIFFSDSRRSLTDLRGTIDDTTFSGSLECLVEKRPYWKIDLHLGTLDFDRYRPSPSSKSNTPWPIKQLKAFDLEGRLKIDSFNLFQVAHSNLDIPLSLKNGIAKADPIRAVFSGGTLGAGVQVEATPRGALTRVRYTLNKVDMLALSQSRKLEQLLAGTGYLDADIRGLLRSSEDIPRALNGTWSFRILNGLLRSALKPDDIRLRFQSLGASGRLTNGVLHSTDLLLSGRELSVLGQGNINLVQWTLQCNLLVTLGGISNIPVRYYGSLDNPQRSVNATGVLFRTLGSIGSGVLDLLDSLLSVPRKVISPSKGFSR